MTPTTTPARRHILPIERLAGVASQFEPTEGGYLFRRSGFGPAIRVTEAEHDTLVRAGTRALLLHITAFALCGWAGWLAVVRAMPGAGDHAVGAVIGIVVSLTGLGLYGSLRWHADAPARALSARRAERPARDPDFSGYPGYGTIVGWTILLLFAVIVRPQPVILNVVLAICGAVLALFLACRRRWFVGRLTSGQLAHAKEVKKQAHRRDDPQVSRASFGQLVLLLLFFVLEIAALWAGIVLTIEAVAAITGQASGDLPFGVFMVAFLVGLGIGGLFVWPLDALCRRWTGESAFHAFDFLTGW